MVKEPFLTMLFRRIQFLNFAIIKHPNKCFILYHVTLAGLSKINRVIP